ncbi:hypothetical protein Tco_1184036 [Tanacetum coccineum]
MAFIQLGGNSRVVEMILARVSSGFAGKKYGKTSNDYVETTKFNCHEINFKSGWLLVSAVLASAVLAQMAHLVANITFASTSIGSTSFLPSVLLLTIVVAIVGVAVVVVVAGAVVESSSVVKLSFVVTRYLHWSMLSYLIH